MSARRDRTSSAISRRLEAPESGPRRTRAAGRTRRPEHAAAAPARCAILTVSDTRSVHDDPGGDALQELVERSGHRAVRRAWATDDVRAIRRAARAALADPRVDALIATGGTGMAVRDVTPEALAPLVERAFPGFGELFRLVSWAEVGSASWLSRAGAGVARGRLVFWLPGSPAGATLALRELILPELGHALRLLGRLPSKE